MCRFLAYSGPAVLMEDLVFRAENSLVNQSKQATMRVDPLNGDGFGIGWYPEHDDKFPGTFVSIEPAWSNRNLIQLAAKIKTRYFFAHVRDASPGMPVSQSNCHPFQFGPYLWMHNGRLEQFSLFRRNIMRELSDKAFEFIKGNTDSECAFAMFLDEIDFDHNASEQRLIDAMKITIEKISHHSRAVDFQANALINFAVSNSQTSLFTRLSTRKSEQPASLFYQQQTDKIIVSSEPLFAPKDSWTKVDRHSLVIVNDAKVKIESLRNFAQ